MISLKLCVIIKQTLLIDQDILLFKFACRHEFNVTWKNGAQSQATWEDLAKQDTDDFIAKIVDHCKCDDYICCMTSPDNFRYKVLPTYKHNRVGKEKPALWSILKDHALGTHPCKLKPHLEADDLMGVLGSIDIDRYVVATIDKDLLSVPCRVYNWNKSTKIQTITEEEADYWFYKQTLMGDPTDGYTGVPRIGAVKAEKLLDSIDTTDQAVVWEMILEQFAKKGLDEAYALQQARVARICRHTDYDFKKQEVILWTPSPASC